MNLAQRTPLAPQLTHRGSKEWSSALKQIAVMTAAALIGAGSLASTGAEARGRGGAVAAGVIGGLALGGLAAGAANSGYGYGYGRSAYGYDDGYYGGYRGAGYGAYDYGPRYRRPAYDYYGYGY
ncbi:hypothetical protein MMMDOFMJ_2245 [Methylobacterium gnaphalii]|nr:hypothetical protein MMMDOFMJ_2245 [Methylobacterium gnaphalii]